MAVFFGDFRYLLSVLLILVFLPYLEIYWVNVVCAVLLALMGIFLFVLTISNKSNQSGLLLLVLFASYFNFSNIKPDASSEIDYIFWGLFFFDIMAQFVSVRKFKRPLMLQSNSILAYNLFQIIFFTALTFLPWWEGYKYLFLGIGLICSVDYLLILYWLPYFVPKINSSIKAYTLKKEYHKIYGKK